MATQTLTTHFVSIFRSADGIDCSNRGPSSRFTQAVLFVGEVPAELEQIGGEALRDDVAVFRLDTAHVMGKPYLKAVPVGERRWTMFGGNFLWSSDSRFRQEVSERPIPIHDRVEG